MEPSALWREILHCGEKVSFCTVEGHYALWRDVIHCGEKLSFCTVWTSYTVDEHYANKKFNAGAILPDWLMPQAKSRHREGRGQGNYANEGFEGCLSSNLFLKRSDWLMPKALGRGWGEWLRLHRGFSSVSALPEAYQDEAGDQKHQAARHDADHQGLAGEGHSS